MKPRILIIDDAAYFRTLIRHLLASCIPGAELIEYDPMMSGKPGVDFSWADYDVLLLDYKLGDEDGLAWFQEFSSRECFPPTILFTGEGDEKLAVLAIKQGVADYLSKDKLSPATLKESLEGVLPA